MTPTIQRISRKRHRVILLPLGLVNFRFHYDKTLKPIIFMISGFSNVSMTPKSNIIYLWRHTDIPNNSRKKPNHFWRHAILGNLKMVGNPKFWKIEKDIPIYPGNPSNVFFGNLEYGINIFQKTCNLNLVISDQHLQKNKLKYSEGILVSIEGT